jgi:hypothetical protein
MMMADTEARKSSDAETPTTAPDEPEEAALPEPDPATCKAIAISQDLFQKAVMAGEYDGTDFSYYLEPAGVLQARLVCSQSEGEEPQPAGLLMTRAAWRARTAFLDDGLNPERYELGFPKEVGYVKPISHYRPQSRERALYPWSKRY